MSSYLSIIICTIIATAFAVLGWRIGGAAIREGGDGGLGSFLLAATFWFVAMVMFIVDVCIIIRKIIK